MFTTTKIMKKLIELENFVHRFTTRRRSHVNRILGKMFQ